MGPNISFSVHWWKYN
ncbi:uncharacterized protein FRV6_01000 [Fusarium oxysporum]|uniref:Uncharacterized protein n=1 Tax=Fusarium oxysporum TaxID=5507 RepID=A0A2H3SJW7_FUSOX|nr:uncharacterized protein FRV6_01000 [Fusarium oxysporum]